MQILLCGVGKAEGNFPSLRQRKAFIAGVSPDLLYILLCLGPGGAVRFLADGAVNALAVHHEVDEKDSIGLGKALVLDAVLDDLLAGLQLAHGGAGQECRMSLPYQASL